MPVNDIITRNEYNNIRAKVNGILGTGSGNSGYGQTLNSTDRTTGDSVTINEWTNLRYDIINAFRHQNGTLPSIVSVSEGNTVRYSVVDAPVTTYDTLANGIVTNKFSLGTGRFAQQERIGKQQVWPGVYGASWNTKIACTISFTWTTADAARYFFNSGGLIIVQTERSGFFGGVLSNAQQGSWDTLLTNAGQRSFGGNFPGTGTTPSDGQNWYRLTNVYQQYYVLTASAPYGANIYRLSARVTDVVSNSTGTSKSGQILIELIDNYFDPGPEPSPPPGDAVDGFFHVRGSDRYATGPMTPSGTFTVERPTFSISDIAPA